MGLVLLVILCILMVGGLPAWQFHPYGIWPSGSAGLLALVLIVLLLAGRL